MILDEYGAARLLPAEHPVGQVEPFELRQAPLGAPQENAPGRHELSEAVADEFQPRLHRQRRHLNCQIVAVAVDNQAREIVSLAIDEPAGGRGIIEAE